MITAPNERVQVWDLGVGAEAPLHHWMLTIGEVGEKVDEVAYMDGSKAPSGIVGAGVVLYRESWYGTLPKESMVYDGEVEAIVEAICRSKADRLLVLTDCQSIVKAVDKATGDGLATGGAVGRIWSAAAGKEVALGWIKAHVGIPGNEAADVAAKRGAGRDELVKVTSVTR